MSSSSVKKPIPDEIDLAFAITASGRQADKSFQLMKDSILWILDKYGRKNTKYALITYGDTPKTRFRFSANFRSLDHIKQFVKAVPRSSGGSALDKALKQAEVVFDSAGARPRAQKVLVVITDKESGRSPDDVKAASEVLENKGVKVIPVAIGNEADRKELQNITSDKENVIAVPPSEKPEKLGQDIMTKVLKGKF